MSWSKCGPPSYSLPPSLLTQQRASTILMTMTTSCLKVNSSYKSLSINLIVSSYRTSRLCIRAKTLFPKGVYCTTFILNKRNLFLQLSSIFHLHRSNADSATAVYSTHYPRDDRRRVQQRVQGRRPLQERPPPRGHGPCHGRSHS